jgi:hypothetical protein
MRWFWFVMNTAVRVIWRGTWQAHSVRLISGAFFAGLAALFAYLATDRASALVGILAYPTGLALIYGFDAIRWLTGWHWRWGREWPVGPDGTVQVTIHVKGPIVMMPMRDREEDGCVVWDPSRQRFETQHIQVFRGQGMCLYPSWFPGAPSLTSGTYWILWRDRKQIWRNGKPAGPGKWRYVDFYRIRIKDRHLVPARPTAPPITTPGP